VLVLVLEDLVSYNKAVSPPEMPANQIQDHSQLREKSAFEDEHEDEDEDEDDLRAALHGYRLKFARQTSPLVRFSCETNFHNAID
jgi:hypothetical protein